MKKKGEKIVAICEIKQEELADHCAKLLSASISMEQSLKRIQRITEALEQRYSKQARFDRIFMFIYCLGGVGGFLATSILMCFK